MEDFIEPAFRTRSYDARNVVRVKDRYQQYLFIKHNAYPIDMYVSIQDNNLIMVFDKTETRELYEKYRRYELE